jgi:hypothetical protein
MHNFLCLLTGFCLLLLVPVTPAVGQNLRNDGFQRRNGQMHVLRNGQLRPMTRDARLPTGAVVAKDGFIRTVNGTRTELKEGQGCDLKGNLVTVVPTATGLALSSPSQRQRRSGAAPTVVQAALEDLFGGGRSRDEDDRDDDASYEYDKKRAEQARERLKKEEEWAREEQKRREEYERERGKKWKEKRKKGKGWDD